MHRRLPPLNAVKAFEAAARHGSFTRAADELRVTHGAVSRHVQMLEGWLGLPLFERHNRRVVLTEAGGAYATEIGAALDRIALATARQAKGGRPRLLHVNALATFTLRWLIPRLSGFQRANPSIEVRLTTSNVPLATSRTRSTWRSGAVRTPGRAMSRSRSCRSGASPSAARRCCGACRWEPKQLRQHTLLHAATLPRVWPTGCAKRACRPWSRRPR